MAWGLKNKGMSSKFRNHQYAAVKKRTKMKYLL